MYSYKLTIIKSHIVYFTSTHTNTLSWFSSCHLLVLLNLDAPVLILKGVIYINIKIPPYKYFPIYSHFFCACSLFLLWFFSTPSCWLSKKNYIVATTRSRCAVASTPIFYFRRPRYRSHFCRRHYHHNSRYCMCVVQCCTNIVRTRKTVWTSIFADGHRDACAARAS